MSKQDVKVGMNEWMRRLREKFGKEFGRGLLGVWGSLTIWAAGGKVKAYDPKAMEECHRIYKDQASLTLCATSDEALKSSDALVICTEWKAFRAVDPVWLASNLAERIVIDGRNLFEPEAMFKAGIAYSSIGRNSTV